MDALLSLKSCYNEVTAGPTEVGGYALSLYVSLCWRWGGGVHARATLTRWCSLQHEVTIIMLNAMWKPFHWVILLGPIKISLVYFKFWLNETVAVKKSKYVPMYSTTGLFVHVERNWNGAVFNQPFHYFFKKMFLWIAPLDVLVVIWHQPMCCYCSWTWM